MKPNKQKLTIRIPKWIHAKLLAVAEAREWNQTRTIEEALDKGLNWFIKKDAILIEQHQTHKKTTTNEGDQEPQEEVTDEQVEQMLAELFNEKP